MKFNEMTKEQRVAMARKGGLTSAKVPRQPKPFCNHGHAMTPENTYTFDVKQKSEDGQRVYSYTTTTCKECKNEDSRKRKAAKRMARIREKIESAPKIAMCSRGRHEMTPENAAVSKRTRKRKDGTEYSHLEKRCRACTRERDQSRVARKRALR